MLKIFLIFLFFLFSTNIKAQDNDYFLMLKYDKVNVRFGPSKEDQCKICLQKNTFH